MATIDMTAASVAESAKLQRHFGRFDILFFLICTIVGVDTIATVAQGGGQAFTWMMVFALVFFVPQALLFAELGTAFPQEGGPYLWTRLAFGHLAGAVNDFLYWITNPVWIGGSLTASCIGGIVIFFNHGNSLSTTMTYVVALVFVWITIVSAIMSFRYGKWLPTAGAFARFLVLGLFTITVAIYAGKHGVHGLGAGSYKPSAGGFVLLTGVLLFNFVGFELPNSAGEEMINPQRDVPFSIARSAIGSVILYALPVLGILIVLPNTAVQNFSGFASAMQDAFTVYGGHVASDGTVTLSGAGTALGDMCAILFIICLITSGATWIMGSDRALAVSCYDGAGPRFLGVIDAKFGTPVRVNIFSGLVASGVVVLATELTNGNAAKYFGAVLGVTISTTLISYLLIYPALWKLRRSRPDVPRPFKMPFHRPLTVLLMILVAIASVQLIAPGLGDSWFGGGFIPDGWAYSERWVYLWTELIPVLVFIGVGVLFWWLGRKTRAEVVTGPAEVVASGLTTLRRMVLIPDASLFGLDNLPYGVFSDGGGPPRVGVRLADSVIDLAAALGDQLFAAPSLNPFMATGPASWARARARIIELVRGDAVPDGAVHPLGDVELTLPFEVADYVDFYASEAHASNLGRLFRPDNPEPLLPNWKHLPVGYHGRAGTIVVSGTDIVRPSGQRKGPDDPAPLFGPSVRLDIEAELGFVVGVGSPLGAAVTTADFADRVFGVVLVNDWSARDLQAWEYVPLGPHLGKSFATSVSAWVTPLAALAAARGPLPGQDPPVLPYLREAQDWGLDIDLAVEWNGEVVSRPPYASMYWSPAQMLAHMTVNGASTRAGDLFASGTISGLAKDQRGAFIELTWGGAEPITVKGEARTFLVDGDTVTITATAPGTDGGRIALGEVTGVIRPARPA